MQIQVRLFAGLRERAGKDELVLDGLPEGLDVAAVKRLLEERHPELGRLEHVRGVLGTSYVQDTAAVSAGAELSLLPPVSGGQAGADELYERGVFEIHADPIDPAGAQLRVQHPSCGAVLGFTGLTRDNNRGQDVVRLDYEAFAEMAGTEMEKIFSECRGRIGCEGDPEKRLRMLVLHRTGTVGVGEPSVVVAVASPHRDAAFEAGRFLIDELKTRVPLWKKELYGDGHHWINDRS